MALLVLNNGNMVAPHLIKSVVKYKGKGVALRNEFNKFIDFIKETDERRQEIIVNVLRDILTRRDWVQPDWDEEFRDGE